MKIAAFIDRDGVINELPSYQFGDDKVEYITKEEQIRIIGRASEAIRLLNDNNVEVIIVSNQPQIARGLVTIDEVDGINKHIDYLLGDARIDAFYFCPHRPTKGINEYGINCDCRKPKPGLILKAAEERGISIEKSYIIGDRTSDINAGKSAGCKTSIGVRTGYGCDDGVKDAVPDIMVSDLLEAAKYIVGDLE